ncbi:MAG: leucine-rich repeat protein [Solobacterium sp.]|nr:leucine-rich repeat protein [Solobacterium sp.]
MKKVLSLLLSVFLMSSNLVTSIHAEEDVLPEAEEPSEITEEQEEGEDTGETEETVTETEEIEEPEEETVSAEEELEEETVTETYGDYEYTSSGREITITKYNGRASSVSIPNEINGNRVVSIGPDAFNGNGLTELTIPENVNVIRGNAFAYCANLKKVYFNHNHFLFCTYEFSLIIA